MDNNMNGNTDNTNYYESNYQQPQYQQPVPPQQPELEEPVTLGEWLITYLIMMIPCVNIVMMFIWAFGKNEKKSKSNYFKASLIVFSVSILFSLLMAFIFGGILAATMSNIY